MPHTVLSPLGLTTDVWNMGRVQLIQLLMHIWGLYQALIANYQELQAQNTRLQQIAADAEQRAADAEQRAEDAEQCAADAEQRAEDAEQRAEDAEQCAAAAEQHAENWQHYAEKVEKELNAMMERDEAKADILHELSRDSSDWTSVSKVNFVEKQTNAVLKAKKETAKKQAELDKLNSLISKLVDCLPFDGVTQEPVRYPVIIVPSDSTMDAKIVNIGSAMNLKSMMGGKFPTGHGANIQSIHECADVKTMYEAIFKLLKLCGHNLDE